uniref:Uncharacterized protein n=1 Tax=Panagrolaimus superbus TaxID=310955 RepID=A0A914YV21_9BILA
MKPVIVILFAFLLIGALDNFPLVNAGIDWDKVDPLCTLSCGAYWVCVAKSSDCKRPSNCVCEEFAGK